MTIVASQACFCSHQRIRVLSLLCGLSPPPPPPLSLSIYLSIYLYLSLYLYIYIH